MVFMVLLVSVGWVLKVLSKLQLRCGIDCPRATAWGEVEGHAHVYTHAIGNLMDMKQTMQITNM